MTLTPTPQTEASLLAWAEYEGQDANVLADILLANALDRIRAEEIAAIRIGLADCEAGRVRPSSEFMAKMQAKYNLPMHLSDKELYAGDE
jgi:predicted transcriptional regulator